MNQEPYSTQNLIIAVSEVPCCTSVSLRVFIL